MDEVLRFTVHKRKIKNYKNSVEVNRQDLSKKEQERETERAHQAMAGSEVQCADKCHF